MSPGAVLSTIALFKWPLTLVGAFLVFGLSTDGTLSLVSSNAGKFTKPVAIRSDFNMPPVKQLADIDPLEVVPQPSTNADPTVAPTDAKTTTQATLREPAAATDVAAPGLGSPDVFDASEPSNLLPGRIGNSAVNIRSGPSKASAKLGVLSAGAEVRIGEQTSGWVHVWYEGGEGWVYSSYLAGRSTASTASITVRGGNDTTTRRKAEVGSRIVARQGPDGDSESLFRLVPGERVHIVGRKGKWLKVETATGETGWIRAKS
jgi:SH3-like domain-containing protein